MRIVAAIDADLMVPANLHQGMAGQMEAITRVVEGISWLLESPHQVALTHGNNQQIDFMLLRAEIASHAVHPLPLDVCGSDTQGATGYMLQQAVQNQLRQSAARRGTPCKEVVTLITQVRVDQADPALTHPDRALGPYYDQEKARVLSESREWVFHLFPGRGYRRVVPALAPLEVIEVGPIRSLLAGGAMVICAGGGGVPVFKDSQDNLVGLEAVVDHNATTRLLAGAVDAQAIVFITQPERLKQVLPGDLNGRPLEIAPEAVGDFIRSASGADLALKSKLAACQAFLASGGQAAVIAPPGRLDLDLESCRGLQIFKGLSQGGQL